jgi:hypothetical protein
MKKPTKSFAEQYPYLAYWINKWGYIKIGYDYDFPYGGFLMVIDQGGVCYECAAEDTLDAAFANAEKHLREKEAPDKFDKEAIANLEKQYKK